MYAKPLSFLSPVGARRGFALVIVLSFLVLVTFAVVAFFSRTIVEQQTEAASSGRVGADLLAQSASNLVIADLQTEMIVGSKPSPVTNGGVVLDPLTVQQMVPAQSIKSTFGPLTGYENLVKQSVVGQTLFTPPAASATNLKGVVYGSPYNSTKDSSTDGHIISAARWSAPTLTVNPFTLDTQTPDWVYMNRGGVVKTFTDTASARFGDGTPGNTNYVIGRFAFNVYDEGGLLDINAAGADQSNTSIKAYFRGSSAFADLTQIPGIASAAAVTKLLAWRNSASASDYLSFVQTWGEPNGFLRLFSAGTGATAVSDHVIVNRQDLIRFANSKIAGSSFDQDITPTALPYLTTYSREVNQPIIRFDPARPKITAKLSDGGNDQYNNDDPFDNQPKANGSMSNPKLWNSDGTPVFKRRFPLDRLKFVVTPPTDAQKVYDYFGLIWDSSNNRWVYFHPAAAKLAVPSTPPTPDGIIHYLSELKDQREPDFFEVIQAGVEAGSLGKQYGITDTLLASSVHKKGGDDGYTAYQVMQIGANIIDQYDTNGTPTRIYFVPNSGRETYGIEDLPYLYRARAADYAVKAMANMSPAQTPPGGRPVMNVLMLQPELWNPHSVNSGSSINLPTHFRVLAKTRTQSGVVVESETPYIPAAGKAWESSAFNANLNGGNGPNLRVYSQYSNDPADPNFASIIFQTDATTSASFREPRALKVPNFPPNSLTDGTVDNPDPSALATGAAIAYPALPDTKVTGIYVDELQTLEAPPATNTLIGFRLGYHANGPAQSQSQFFGFYRYVCDPISLYLQYQDPTTSQYWTYDIIEASTVTDLCNAAQREIGTRWDPRSDRWGLGFVKETFRQPGMPKFYVEGATMEPQAGQYFIQGLDSTAQFTDRAGVDWRLVKNGSRGR